MSRSGRSPLAHGLDAAELQLEFLAWRFGSLDRARAGYTRLNPRRQRAVAAVLGRILLRLDAPRRMVA